MPPKSGTTNQETPAQMNTRNSTQTQATPAANAAAPNVQAFVPPPPTTVLGAEIVISHL